MTTTPGGRAVGASPASCRSLKRLPGVEPRRPCQIPAIRLNFAIAAGKKQSLVSPGDEGFESIVELSGRAMAAELTISAMSKRYHLTFRALRFYEEFGLISPRREGSQRFYGDEVHQRVGLILQGKALGFSLAEIKEIVNNASSSGGIDFDNLLLDHQILEQIKYLEWKSKEINNAIARLRGRLSRRQGVDEGAS
jgi:DNA-binding transcriptional MerR regulator